MVGAGEEEGRAKVELELVLLFISLVTPTSPMDPQ